MPRGNLKKELGEYLYKLERVKAGEVIKVSPELFHYLTTQVTDGKNIKAADLPDTIFDTAKGLVYGARNEAYGHPRDNQKYICGLFNAYKDIVDQRPSGGAFTPTDIALLNILQKVARLATNPTHMDSVQDVAGYAGVIERLITDK